MKKKAFFFAIAIIALGVVAVLFLHKDIGDPPRYVTSAACAGCHPAFHAAWSKTLHPRMFRPVGGPGDILGDFDSGDPAVTFTKEDVEFVIGNKWEQVYARMIDGEYYPLPAKWYITTQKWVPYKVDDWKETPLSTQCNGCHTTGFDPDTYEFAEFGIGCEACHGPGSVHAAKRRAVASPICATCHRESPMTKGEIVVSVNSAVCGQCHNRGNQVQDKEHIQTTFRFPIGYTPGEELGPGFEPVTPETDTKKQYWWDIGVSKNRHQEYADFAQSKHSKSLRLLKEKHTPERGELTDDCLRCHSTDYRLARPGEEPTLKTARHGITCVACHEPHGLDRHFRSLSIDANRCGLCHADSMSVSAADKGRPHYPGPPSAKQCADCHMPYIVGSGGAFPIRSHAFQIVPPSASKEFDMPNSCQNGGCHVDESVDWAIREFQAFYPDFGEREDSALDTGR